jgi:hypothetical protein
MCPSLAWGDLLKEMQKVSWLEFKEQGNEEEQLEMWLLLGRGQVCRAEKSF